VHIELETRNPKRFGPSAFWSTDKDSIYAKSGRCKAQIRSPLWPIMH